jgi:ATP phosphoribosyltransferase regulatory subunit
LKNSIPSGVVQFFEPISSTRRKIENSLIDFYVSNGYSEIVTSLFSYENSLFEGLFEPLKTQLFKIIDKNSGQTMILRADITMQITQAIMMGNFDMPVRICYADNIYRDVKEHSGEKREFKQTGVELFGIKDISADREVMELSISSLKNIGIEKLCLRLSDTYIIENLFREYGINDKEQINEIKKLLNRKNLSLILKTFGHLDKGFLSTLKELSRKSGYFSEDDNYLNIRSNAENVIDLACSMKKQHPDIDIFLDLFYCEYPIYHHGIVFEIFSNDRSLAVGGRYGNVTKPFGKYIPATGFAINLDELSYFLIDKEINENE